eukprot:SM000106S13968  [mRNA]  locus=s106:278382:280365:- [translate_table: standard]
MTPIRCVTRCLVDQFYNVHWKVTQGPLRCWLHFVIIWTHLPLITSTLTAANTWLQHHPHKGPSAIAAGSGRATIASAGDEHLPPPFMSRRKPWKVVQAALSLHPPLRCLRDWGKRSSFHLASDQLPAAVTPEPSDANGKPAG